MIPKKKELKLIKIYMYISDLYDSELKYYHQIYSNNNVPSFTDPEIMTFYLFEGFCFTKNQYYFGLKLHALAFKQKGRIPFSESITFTPAENNDLTVFKQNWDDTISDRTIFGDKVYTDFENFDNQKKKTQNIEMLTPVKGLKGQYSEQNNKIRLTMICFLLLFPKSDNL